MEIGIDKIGFYTPNMYVDMNDLAVARNVDPGKFIIGIGQDEMAVPPITQDPVTLAANAALSILDDVDREAIDFVMFGTESGIDHSKSAAVYVHQLLGIQPHARSIELKQACYSATSAIQLAKGHISLNPESRVLVLASDIARYGLNSGGEVTQGAGAVAMVISRDPQIMVIEDQSTYLTKDIMDFWRPTYSDVAFVDGKFSNEQYIAFFQEVWNSYKKQTGQTLQDFTALCFHIPYTKMGLKAFKTILDEVPGEEQECLLEYYEMSTEYSRKVGNIYTASLYLGLVSLLEQANSLKAGDRVGMFSYGSGAVGEFFTGILQDDFREGLFVEQHEAMFSNRRRISVAEYEKVFMEELPTDGSTVELAVEADPAPICLVGMKEHMRQYVVK